MQFRKFSRLSLWVSFLISLPLLSFTQVLRENEHGEKIIVYEDGTWQYFADFSQNGPVATAGTQNNNSKKSFPIYDGTIEPLAGYVSITEDDILKIAVRKSQIAQEAAAISQERANKAKQARVALENELLIAQSSKDKNSIEQLKIRLEAAKRAEQETIREVNAAVKEASRAEELTAKGNYVKAFTENQSQKKRQSQINKSRQELSALPYDDLIPVTENYGGKPQRNDLILNPPATPCKIVYEGKDERTGQWRKDVHKQLLFTHTDERLRPFLKEKEYMRCEGYMTSVGGGFRFLTLQFTFAYPNAREAYGFIEKGSILTVKLLNGDFINLFASKMDKGSYDTEQELLTYRVHYPVDRSQIGLLKNSEVDAIRVFWSSGYEEYEVYQLDFFLQQLDCLEQ
ncbi:MAG: hypothetical protein DHS20C18_17780 [Saprospiraceae bacterium]|nr:MAG: hypothetical protein DHS20C18_17780 [Saprospiraceae bacterium]